MRELREHQADRERLLSHLTLPTAEVADIGQLKAGCGRSKYKLALLSMLEATTNMALGPDKQLSKVEVHTAPLNHTSLYTFCIVFLFFFCRRFFFVFFSLRVFPYNIG